MQTISSLISRTDTTYFLKPTSAYYKQVNIKNKTVYFLKSKEIGIVYFEVIPLSIYYFFDNETMILMNLDFSEHR